MESKLSRALAPKRPDAPTLTSRQLVKAWWQALRPPFFIVDLIPVGLGGALAARDLGYWPWGIFAVVRVGCFCLHTVANIANDLFDYLEGVDTDETIGGTKVIQNGWISPRQICLTIIGLLLSTVLIGWWLIGHSGQEWLWGPVVFAMLSAVTSGRWMLRFFAKRRMASGYAPCASTSSPSRQYRRGIGVTSTGIAPCSHAVST